jgi:hypothetical protein
MVVRDAPDASSYEPEKSAILGSLMEHLHVGSSRVDAAYAGDITPRPTEYVRDVKIGAVPLNITASRLRNQRLYVVTLMPSAPLRRKDTVAIADAAQAYADFVGLDLELLWK